MSQVNASFYTAAAARRHHHASHQRLWAVRGVLGESKQQNSALIFNIMKTDPIPPARYVNWEPHCDGPAHPIFEIYFDNLFMNANT